MRTPTIHLNGTSVDELAEQYTEAIAAMRMAVRQVALACPNGRDYYVQGGDAVSEAQQEHIARLEKLNQVANELNTIFTAIEQQREDRERQKR